MTNAVSIWRDSADQFNAVRTLVESDGKVLFCATDIASSLGYANSRKAISDHCKGVTKRDTPTSSGEQSLNFIPEGDVYRLIIRSRLPSAERFERWVFDEIMPSIRSNGQYVVGKQNDLSQQIQLMDMLVKQAMATEEKIQAMQEKIETLETDHNSLTKTWLASTSLRLSNLCKLWRVSEPKTRGMLYTRLEDEMNCNLALRQRRLRERLKKTGAKYKECEEITKLHAIAADGRLREEFEKILSHWSTSICPNM